MRISLDLSKTVDQNAQMQFEKAKKIRKKAEGARTALEDSRRKLAKIEDRIDEERAEEKQIEKRKTDWYEKFRWFFSSEGFLVIAGRDATTNEIIMKKQTDKDDLVFHTSMAGSPFAVIKRDGKEIGEKTIEETSKFVACFSRAWKLGMSSMEVFHVNPDQVTKEAPAGEYIQKGSFMIYGKKNTVLADMDLWIGAMEDGKIMAAARSAVEKHCKSMIRVQQGKEKPSEAAKTIRHKLGGELDEIIRVLPSGGVRLGE